MEEIQISNKGDENHIHSNCFDVNTIQKIKVNGFFGKRCE